MNIEVTRDNVTILEQSEIPHENEYKITTCYFTFDEFTSSFQVKRAIFTILSTEEMYETDIINNQCDIPSEVLEHEYETVKLGVYGYNIGDNEELLNRFSPSYAEIIVPTGSYKEGALSPEPITPSQYDLYSQALQEGLQEVDDKLDEVVETVDGKLEEVDDKLEEVDGKIQDMDDALDDVDTAIANTNEAIERTNNLNLDVSDKVDGDVTVTLTKKDATTKSVVISDGTSLEFVWQGTSLGVKTEDMEEYVFVDLQGQVGPVGPQGNPFQIKKTYSTVQLMIADYDNMEINDYVMISGNIEQEDNAKLFVKTEEEDPTYRWQYLADFSGASGIVGPTGATPNIQIGTVTSGSTPSVTRTGTNENPVLNFVLQPGPQGQTGQTGATGNGIASITKTSTSGLVDTYTITFTDGNTTTFNVENGNGIDHISLTSQSGATKVYTIYFTDGNTTTFTVEDGEVTQEVFDEEIERANMIYNAMPKVSDEDTEFSLNNTAECPVYDIELKPSELEQKTTSGKNLVNCPDINATPTGNDRYLINNFDIDNTKTYTLSFYYKYNNTGFSSEGAIIILRKDTTYESLTSSSDSQGQIIKQITGTSKLSIYITSRLSSGSIDVQNVMLEQSSTATEYEEYTGGIASPNPDYPQQIHRVSGENTVDIHKNFFDGKIEQGSFRTEDGTLIDSTTRVRSTNYINVDTDTYVFDLKNNSNYYIVIYVYDENNNYISSESVINWSALPFTKSFSNKRKIKFGIRYANNTTITPTDVEQIIVNSPNYLRQYPISLGDLEYCKIGDYEDEFYKATESDTGLTAGKWYLKKNIGKVVLKGSEDGWSSASTSTIGINRFFTSLLSSIIQKPSTSSTLGNGICNYFSLETADQTYSKNNGFGIHSNGNIFFYDDLLKEYTIAQFREWLSAHNTIVYYILATPTYTLLSDTLQTQLDNIQKALSYQGQTNVSQVNDDLPFVIKMSAIRDLSGIFELIQ